MRTVRNADGAVYVQAEPLTQLLTQIYRRAGCHDEEAECIATRLCGANLRGHDSHGVIRTPRYVDWIDEGRQVPNARISIINESDTLAMVDGQFGFGQSIGEQTIDLGIAKAKKGGVAVTALRNSGHLGRIGDWAERAAAENIASIHMVNVRGSLLVAPFGAIDRRGSTSPFCAGVPLEGEDPVILDFATSLVAEGKALVALRGGKPLPEGALIRETGELTNDPTPLYGETKEGNYPNPSNGPGALTGFGLHKGSGLNFFMEMFAGALTGSGTAGALGESERRRFCNGMLSIFMDVNHFHTDDWFAKEVRAYIEFFKSARPAEADGEILIPGEKERRTMSERLETGLPLAPMVWDDIQATARRVGINDAQIQAQMA